MQQDFYLEENVDKKVINCYRCGYQVQAIQVRVKGQFEASADGTTGILQRTLRSADDPADD